MKSMTIRHLLLTCLFFIPVIPAPLFCFPLDSLFEPLIRPFDLLPDYYLRFNLSTFALHRDAFFKRQYLAEPRPDLEFRLLSWNDIVSSVWKADFRFGLGEVPGNNVFTVLNVAFGIDPTFEVRLPKLLLTTGLTHRCYHEIDRSDFPIVHNNRLHLGASSHNRRRNDFFHGLNNDSTFSFSNRFSWQMDAGYYLRDFFTLVSPEKLNGNSPLVTDVQSTVRYAFHRRRSWIFTFKGSTTAGYFDGTGGYQVTSNGVFYWKQSFGTEAFFIRGTRGGSLHVVYHIDDLPVPPDTPSFTLGNSRFSKNGLLEIGIVFFN